jgi:hypothetical protein
MGGGREMERPRGAKPGGWLSYADAAVASHGQRAGGSGQSHPRPPNVSGRRRRGRLRPAEAAVKAKVRQPRWQPQDVGALPRPELEAGPLRMVPGALLPVPGVRPGARVLQPELPRAEAHGEPTRGAATTSAQRGRAQGPSRSPAGLPKAAAGARARDGSGFPGSRPWRHRLLARRSTGADVRRVCGRGQRARRWTDSR